MKNGNIFPLRFRKVSRTHDGDFKTICIYIDMGKRVKTLYYAYQPKGWPCCAIKKPFVPARISTPFFKTKSVFNTHCRRVCASTVCVYKYYVSAGCSGAVNILLAGEMIMGMSRVG